MAISPPRKNVISSGFNFRIMQTDTAKDMLRVISRYLLSFKLKRVFLLIEFQRLMVWFCKKSWANFNTIPIQVTCQLFPFKSFVPLILSKDFKGQWIILKIHSCSSSYFIRGFKQRCFWATQFQPEVSLFYFNKPWSCQICIAKCLYSYRDHLSKNLQTHF